MKPGTYISNKTNTKVVVTEADFPKNIMVLVPDERMVPTLLPTRYLDILTEGLTPEDEKPLFQSSCGTLVVRRDSSVTYTGAHSAVLRNMSSFKNLCLEAVDGLRDKRPPRIFSLSDGVDVWLYDDHLEYHYQHYDVPVRATRHPEETVARAQLGNPSGLYDPRQAPLLYAWGVIEVYYDAWRRRYYVYIENTLCTDPAVDELVNLR